MNAKEIKQLIARLGKAGYTATADKGALSAALSKLNISATDKINNIMADPVIQTLFTNSKEDHKQDGQEDGKFEKSNNDASWYGDFDLPANVNRPMGFAYSYDFTNYATLGAIPKLNVITVNLPQYTMSARFKTNVTYLFEEMRRCLKSNIVYNFEQVKVFIQNNISLYILAKMLERRLGFMKYEDVDFPEFHELWQYQFFNTQSYGVYPMIKSNEYDVTGSKYSENLDIYKDLCSTIYQCVLPPHMKAWVDHYFGSVFILDDDAKNKKYSVLFPDYVTLYTYSGGVTTETKYYTEQLTPSVLYDLCDQFFHNGLNTVIRADILKLNNLKDTKSLAEFAVGWLTKLTDYTPVAKADNTYKQLVVNGYTSESALLKNNYIRVDTLESAKQDVATAILALGAFGDETTNVFHVRGMRFINSSLIFYADVDHPVILPSDMIQQSAIDHISDLTIDKPSQIVYDTDVSGDTYVSVTKESVGGVDVPVYYPSEDYPVNSPVAKSLVTSFTSSGNVVTLGGSPLVGYAQALNAWSVWSGDLRIYIPITKAPNGSYIMLKSKTNICAVPTNIDLHFTNTADLAAEFDTVLINSNTTYSGNNSAYHGNRGEVVDKLLGINPGMLMLPADFTTVVYGSLSIINSGIDINYFVQITNLTWDFQVMWAQSNKPVKWVLSETISPAASVQWIKGENIIYPSASLTNEYVITDGVIINTEMSVISGFIGFGEYLFTALGYSIPVKPEHNIHTTKIDMSGETVASYHKHLLKEDYIPYVVSKQDLPAVWNDILDGLTSFKVNGK